MNLQELSTQISQKKSYLCVGLDSELSKLPKHLQESPKAIVDFNKAIIQTTKDYCVSYKINTAFYEALGAKGWEIMQETLSYIPSTHFTIADAKRGDIGNTSTQYAKAFFETLNFDAITVAPYMGEDSIRPFLDYSHKVTIVLALTSNTGSNDFETLQTPHGLVYEEVLKKVSSWGNTQNTMFVVGATKAENLQQVRAIVPNHFLLIPGVGFQGGSLYEVSKHGLVNHSSILVNVGRSILYASNKEDFAIEAGVIAHQYQVEMSGYLEG